MARVRSGRTLTDILQEAELRRLPLGEVVAELVALVDVPRGMTWRDYSASLLEGLEPAMAARLADERMVEARASGDRVTRMQSVVVLVAALVERATAFGELLDKIAILQIKSERMSDPAKLAHVRDELAALES